MGRGRPLQGARGAQGWEEASPRIPGPRSLRPLGICSKATLQSQAMKMPRTGGTSGSLGRENKSLLLGAHERVST